MFGLPLWKIIPHDWLIKPCPKTKGEPGCKHPDSSFHTADTTIWFRVAYGWRK